MTFQWVNATRTFREGELFPRPGDNSQASPEAGRSGLAGVAL